MATYSKILLVLTLLFTTQVFANPTPTCDYSVQAVTKAFGENFSYITPDTDLFKDLGLLLPQVSSILLKNWGDCKVDLNVAYGALIHRACSKPACLSKYLAAGRL